MPTMPITPTMNTENLEKASHEADFLTSDLRHAHSDAICAGNHFAAIVLLDLIKDAAALQERIRRVYDAATATT